MNEPARGATGAAAAGPDTPGGMLRAERERRGYSVQHAAEELHLDIRVIEALEANRFEALGAPVYARGHLRKYATILGLSPATVLERYEALGGTPPDPTPIPAVMATPVRVVERRRVSKLPLWIAAAIAIVAGLAWLVFELLQARGVIGRTTREVTAPTVQQPAVSEAATVNEPVAAAPAPVAQAVPKTSPPAAGEVRVRLEFIEPSWAEIYDATGKRLMFDMGTPGRVRTVAGVPPLRVNLGLASAVNAQVDDRPIVIPRRGGRDGAKFVIEADGSVKPDSSLKTAERLE
ncbi:MAG TPA: helix-turn-helix domain-containing protein [Steroidobacteraceae bacterium]|nr:helix-turn-helix domain-containing protein [Steroidobacteraceae bacterium]